MMTHKHKIKCTVSVGITTAFILTVFFPEIAAASEIVALASSMVWIWE